MSDTELKPCPFCGGKAFKRIELPTDEDGLAMNRYVVGCERCHIEFYRLWDEEEVVERWNTRKTMERIVERLEEEIEKSVDRHDNKSANIFDIAKQIVKAGGKND